MHYSKIDKCDFANGPGVRVSIFVSGCSNHCEGCFNKEAWDPTFGQDFTDDTIEEILSAIEERNCDGLSILGGDPLEYYNLKGVDKLIRAFRKKFGFDKSPALNRMILGFVKEIEDAKIVGKGQPAPTVDKQPKDRWGNTMFDFTKKQQ